MHLSLEHCFRVKYLSSIFYIDVLMYLRGQIQNMCLSDTAADTDDDSVSQALGNK